MAVRLQTLGRLAIETNGVASTSLGSQPVRAALLVYVGVERETTRDALTGLVWPDRDAQRARHALSQTLYQLRIDFGDGLITADHETVRATDALIVDAFDFARAAERDDAASAAALYSGRFLEGHRLVETHAYEMWVDQQRARLERLNRRVRRRLIAGLIDEGRPGDALLAARDWAGIDPLEDEAQHRLIALLADAGESGEALRRFEAYEQLLRHEDLAPLDETISLVERIRRERERGTPDTTSPARAPAPASHPPARRNPVRRGFRLVVAAAGLLLAGAAALAAFISKRSDHGLVRDRVLVVPFSNETGDSSLAPVGELAADWIAHGLARTGALQVIPTVDLLGGMGENGEDRGSGSIATAIDAARNAGAGLVVAGRYYSRDDRLELYAQVTDVANGQLIVALDPVVSGTSDPGPAIEDVGLRIMGSLAARFNANIPLESPAVIHPPTYDAYIAYEQGVRLFIRGDNVGAIPHFLRATSLDPEFVRPLLTAASAWSNLGDYAREDSILAIVASRVDALAPYERAHLDWARADLRGDLDAAAEAARRVARLAPGGPANYVAGVRALNAGQPSQALDIFAKLDPSPDWAPVWWNTWLHVTGAYHALGEHGRELDVIENILKHDTRLRMRVLELRALAALGRVDRILSHLDQAMSGLAENDLDVGDVLARTGFELQAHGHATDGDALLQRAVRWYAEFDGPLQPRQQWQRTHVLAATGRFPEAGDVIDSLRMLRPQSTELRGFDGVIAARSGNRDRALAIDDSLAHPLDPYDRGASAYWRAAIHAWLDQQNQAVTLLLDARRKGRALGFSIHADDNLQPLWPLPGFASLVVVRN